MLASMAIPFSKMPNIDFLQRINPVVPSKNPMEAFQEMKCLHGCQASPRDEF
jgi:hypothetical protein